MQAPSPQFHEFPRHVDDLLRTALHAASPRRGVAALAPESLRSGAWRVIAAGKAAADMTLAPLDDVGGGATDGVVVGPPGTSDRLSSHPRASRLRVFDADHPLPTERNVAAARAVETLARADAERPLAVLLSGGASAHLSLPCDGVTLDDLRTLVEHLLRAGAPIEQLNCVRKQIEVLKGGGLALAAFPSRIEALVLSDVVGDDLSTIASGPLALNAQTPADALDALARFDALGVSPRITGFLRAKATRSAPHDPEVFRNIRTTIVGSNQLALDAAAHAAQALGFSLVHCEGGVQGEARDAGRRLIELALSHAASPAQSAKCILLGGETAVRVRGNGIGGRNQELVLSGAIALDQALRAHAPAAERIAIASFATDGVDGLTDAAGAYADSLTCEQARSLGLDPDQSLASNDSYTFFDGIRALLRTGRTGTNVNDISVAMVYPGA